MNYIGFDKPLYVFGDRPPLSGVRGYLRVAGASLGRIERRRRKCK